VAVAIGTFALVIYLLELLAPQLMAFYDSGVYVAASVRLVSGALPYRDFVFVNPPGILVLLAPVGVIGRFAGSRSALEMARVMTATSAALNVGLLAWLVRRRGVVAMAVGGGVMAVLPVAFYVSASVKLDPYCLSLSLLGAIVTLASGSEPPLSGRRVVVGGVLVGLAGSVKLWAVFPFVALVVCLIGLERRRVTAFIAGAAIGFLGVSLPFALADVGGFVHQVLVSQLFQGVGTQFRPNWIWRLGNLEGLTANAYQAHTVVALGAFELVVIAVAAAFWRDRTPDATDLFLLMSAALTAVALLIAPASAPYYGYFETPFLVGLIVVSTSRLVEKARIRGDSRHVRRARAPVRPRVALLAGVALAVSAAILFERFYLREATVDGLDLRAITAVAQVVPSGSCATFDFVIEGVYANRLTSAAPGCPLVVDSYGEWQSAGFGPGPPPAALVARWRSDFEASRYVVLYQPQSSYVPWTNGLANWFAAHYRLVYGSGDVFVYRHEANA
jgi:hypothetical protein